MSNNYEGRSGGWKKNAPSRIRTWDLLIRSQALYPTEPRVHCPEDLADAPLKVNRAEVSNQKFSEIYVGFTRKAEKRTKVPRNSFAQHQIGAVLPIKQARRRSKELWRSASQMNSAVPCGLPN
jgi:hypothetical protein